MIMTSDDKRVMSGFPSLDKITGGFRPGSLNVIAGRPGSGKTSLAMNIAYNAAVKYNKRVLVISLELSKEELANRVLSFVSEGSLDTAKDLVYIDDRFGSFEGVQVNLREDIEKVHPDLIIIDYLEVFYKYESFEKERRQSMAVAMSFLKQLAEKYEIPVIVLSQFCLRVFPCSSTPDIWISDKPTLDEVARYGREPVVQGADVIIIIWPEGYTSKSREVHLASSRNVHLDVAKNKFGDGDVGTVVKFERAKCKYYEEE